MEKRKPKIIGKKLRGEWAEMIHGLRYREWIASEQALG